jgi:citrate/tricarballylate utilization protein
MPETNAMEAANKALSICNACRYCEGFCAVFPAMELRRTFTEGDIRYLANLCHNCRGCYYACQYAPPHPFDLNFPRLMAEVRMQTYVESGWPASFKGIFQRNGVAVGLIALVSTLVVLLLALSSTGPETFFGIHTGPEAFYQVIPYMAMVLPMIFLGGAVLFALFKGMAGQWRSFGEKPADFFDLQANLQAVLDVLKLKYLDGGGHGCNYPDDRFSMIRRYFHHAIFYGFMLCLVSTTIAAIYDHFLHRAAPYPFWSWPVVLGTVGGLALLAGTGGMLYLKLKMDRAPATSRSIGMDVSFTALLFMTSLTGLLLLVLRSTPLMGLFLCLHLGAVVGLFISMPYGKFLHAVYRYAALVKNAREQAPYRASAMNNALNPLKIIKSILRPKAETR